MTAKCWMSCLIGHLDFETCPSSGSVYINPALIVALSAGT
jgi:hypothetical protein